MHPTAYPVSTSSVVDSTQGFPGILPPAESARVLADARRRRFQRGDIVFHEGDPGDTLHLVTEGRFGVQTGTAEGERVLLQIVSVGDVFGELSIFGPDRGRSATVMTIEAGETHSIEARTVRDLCARNPEASSYFLRLLADRSVHHTTRLLEIVFVPAEIRSSGGSSSSRRRSPTGSSTRRSRWARWRARRARPSTRSCAPSRSAGPSISAAGPS